MSSWSKLVSDRAKQNGTAKDSTFWTMTAKFECPQTYENNRKLWKLSEDEYVKAQSETMSIQSIAIDIRRTPGAVRLRQSRLNVSELKKGTFPDAESSTSVGNPVDKKRNIVPEALSDELQDGPLNHSGITSKRRRLPRLSYEKTSGPIGRSPSPLL